MNWTWIAESHVLATKLSPSECEARLRARTAGWPLWRPTADHPVAGSVSRTCFSLTKAISGRNSFQTEARGTLTAEEHGTRIQVTLGPSPLVLVFVLLWLAFDAAFLIAGLQGEVVIGTGLGFPPVAIPVAMLVIGIAVVGLGRLSARRESTFLLRFLHDELQAEELPSAEPSFTSALGGR